MDKELVKTLERVHVLLNDAIAEIILESPIRAAKTISAVQEILNKIIQQGE